MPKPMIRISGKNQQKENHNLTIDREFGRADQTKTKNIDPIKLDRILRKKRSPQYMEAMKQLDAGGHVRNQKKINEILDAIRCEFPEVEIESLLLGCVSECYLGKPYEVHTFTLEGEVLEHYKVGQTLPNGMEKARSIAIRGGYSFIEVYVDCCRAIGSTGEVSVIKC